MSALRYWIAVISQEHALRAISGNFIQVCHGKEAPLKRMSIGDYILVYSSKITMEGSEKCQKFTAVGQVIDDEVYPFQMAENFRPFRRNIKFIECENISIIPLIDELDFIPNKKSWGYPFRFGFLEIKENDFNLIISKMIQNEAVR